MTELLIFLLLVSEEDILWLSSTRPKPKGDRELHEDPEKEGDSESRISD